MKTIEIRRADGTLVARSVNAVSVTVQVGGSLGKTIVIHEVRGTALELMVPNDYYITERENK